MSGQNYVVNYDINVLSADAVSSINSFVTATKKLTGAATNFNKLNNQINNINNRFKALAGKAPVIQIKTSDAERKLDRLIGKLNRISKMSKGLNIPINVNETQRVSGGRSSNRRTTVVSGRPKNMGSIRYNALGQTLIDTGGVGAIDLLKGMGIAYGISGIGSLMSDVVKDSAEYDNLIQTTRNILKTHDFGADFAGRFHEMERTIRNVGVETKFTAPQVADASKFLAMAGFDIDAINKSIRPISDIALVGDTDLGETADVVTNIMTGYGISPDRIRQAADVMTMTFTKSNTTLMELAEAYKYSASLLSINGTSFEEATAAIGILGDAGIKGSQAGTTMRTLALNIAKPTKGQREMWESLGIDRFDKNGQLRPLVEIFQDLNEQNLGLAQFGALFHKTAAQGAASLAANVDKWNEIIKLNFLSDGVVADLANAKKNTIQGLWAQVTSAFTEAGMLAFEEIEQPIKDMMNTAVGWLTSDVGKKTVRDFAMDVWDIVKAIADLTKHLFKLYQQFTPVITGWIKLQAVLSISLIPLRAINALKNYLKYLGALIPVTSTLSKNMTILNGTGFGLGASGSVGYLKGRGVDPKTIARYNSIYGNKFNPAGLLGVGGAYLGGRLTGGSVLGTLLGAAAGSLLPSGLGWINGKTGLAASISRNVVSPLVATLSKIPIVAGSCVAAFATLAAAFTVISIKASKAAESSVDFLRSIQSVNGIDLSEHASITDKYLSIVYNKQLDVNSALSEYITLRKDELGLLSGNVDTNDKTPFKDLDEYKSSFKNFAYPFKWYNLFGIGQNKLLTNDGFKEDMHIASSKGFAFTDTFNGITYDYNKGGKENTRNALGAARYLYGLGQNLAAGTDTQKKVELWKQQFLQASTMADYQAVLSNFENEMAALRSNIIPGSETWSFNDIGNKPLSEVFKGYHYVTAQIKTLQEALFTPGRQLDFWKQILQTNDAGKIPSSDLLSNFLFHSGIIEFNKEWFGNPGSNEWYNYLGWSNGQYNPISGLGVRLSPEEAQKYYAIKGIEYTPEEALRQLRSEGLNLTAAQAQKNMGISLNQATDLVRHLAVPLQGLFSDYISDALWKPDSILGLEAGKSKKMLNGIEYTWDGKNWIPNKLATSQKPLTNAEMEAQLKGVPNLNTTSGDGSGTGGYSNHYKSTTAVPKQIIVKIENLMNVESIDMTNPDNAAVVENLKDQMAQVLIDVVADFNANASNLT